MTQLPSSGRHSMLYRGKSQGGHANWYRGIRWAFRTRWRLVSLGNVVREKLVQGGSGAYFGRGGFVGIAGFRGHLFGFILV